LLFCEPLTPQNPPHDAGEIGAAATTDTPIEIDVPLIPRILIMMEERFMPAVIPLPDKAISIDWHAQSKLAPNRLVRSHIVGANMNFGAMRCMANHWGRIRDKHERLAGKHDDLVFEYAKATFSWLLQAAAHGLEGTPEVLATFLRENPRLGDPAVLEEVLEKRGQSLTEDIRRLISGA
jgi:hypothetical protein